MIPSNDDLIHQARAVVWDRKLAGDNTAGGVGAALVTRLGNIYLGVCIDTGSGMGFCAEHAAVAAMVTARESSIAKVVAVWIDKDGKLFVLPPCGRCREFMSQIDESNLDTAVVLGRDQVAPLRELLPFHEWPEPYS